MVLGKLTVLGRPSNLDQSRARAYWMFSGPLRQYFSLYQAVSEREGERGERIERKNVQTTPPAPTASAIGPCPTMLQFSRTPRHWKFTQHHRLLRLQKVRVGGCLDIFSLVYHFSFLLPEMARYRPKYCLKGPLSPKQQTNLGRLRPKRLTSTLCKYFRQ